LGGNSHGELRHWDELWEAGGKARETLFLLPDCRTVGMSGRDARSHPIWVISGDGGCSSEGGCFGEVSWGQRVLQRVITQMLLMGRGCVWNDFMF